MSTIALSCGISGITLSESVVTASVPDAFGVAQWSLSDPGLGDSIQISLNALPSSLGGPLTRVQHNIDGAGWIDFVLAPTIESFDVPVSSAAGQPLYVEIRALNAAGVGPGSDVKSITLAQPFSLTSTVEDEIEVYGIGGTLTFTIAAPSIYANFDAGNSPGIFVVNSTDMDVGPVNLVPPQISGGDNLTVGAAADAAPGLWVYDGDITAPTPSYRWLRNGIPIIGETGTRYILQAEDVGQQVTVEEKSTASSGARVAISAPILTAGSIMQASPVLGDTLTVAGSNASALATYQWQLDGIDISGATAAAYDTANQLVGEYRRSVRDGTQGSVYTQAVTVTTVNAVAVHMGEQDRPTVATLTPTTQIDVSSRTVGDLLIFTAAGAIFSGDPLGATVNGSVATEVTKWNWGSAARGALFSYALQQADIDAGIIDVVVTVGSASVGSRVVFDFVITTGGLIADFAIHVADTSVAVTTTRSVNTIYHFVHGVSDRFNGAGPTYTGVLSSRLYKLDVGGHGSAAGIVHHAAVGLNTVTFTIDGSGNYAGVAVVVE